jgi:kinesin family protein 2/24
MMGCRPEAPAEAVVNAGLYVLAARDIFLLQQAPEYRRLRVFVSCFEIYGGKLFDLLNERGVVKCLEDAKQQVRLMGTLTTLVCSSDHGSA